MDTCICEFHFPNGCTKELTMNTIAEALYALCNLDGNQYAMLDAIVDYKKNHNVAISRSNQVKIVNGKKIFSHSTCGWELCCEWKDGSTSWQKLSDLKESQPLQVAEFALAMGIAYELAFNWWWTHKFGIELPKTVDEAYAINKATGTTFWHDAFELEIKNL
ncbi:hypothetical protein ACHAW6_005592 [Cyclotella cf. meneghiniana]